MNRQEATDFVIRELGKHRLRNNIIQELCEMSGMNWSAAEKFIQQVEDANTSEIARRQSPLAILVGITTALVGLFLMFWTLQVTLQGTILFPLDFPMPYLGNIVCFALGVAAVIGGLRGMWDTILQIWNI